MRSNAMRAILLAAVVAAAPAVQAQEIAPEPLTDAEIEAESRSTLEEAARLQDPDVAYAALRACLADSGGSRRMCDGAHRDACEAFPTNASTIARRGCALAEAEAWERVMADAYAHIEAAVSGSIAAADEIIEARPEILQTAQDAWIAFRRAHCDSVLMGYTRGATEIKVSAAECRRATAANRALELLRLADDYAR